MTVYYAECKECGWKSPHRKRSKYAEDAAQKHYDVHFHSDLEIVEATVTTTPHAIPTMPLAGRSLII